MLFLIATMFLSICGAKAQNSNKKIVYHIPPPSGPGTGVCYVTLTIQNKYIIAIKTCGGHNEHGHTESSKKLFKKEFISNHKYKVSELINTKYGSSFGCEYFEIMNNKLYLYDENKNVINDWFCKYGNIEIKRENMETCDCVFLPTEN